MQYLACKGLLAQQTDTSIGTPVFFHRESEHSAQTPARIQATGLTPVGGLVVSFCKPLKPGWCLFFTYPVFYITVQ